MSEQHDPLCSEGVYIGDQRMPCDCRLARMPPAEPTPPAQERQTEHAYRVAAAWREGAELAGNAQPLPDLPNRWKGRATSEIAALERGFAFIHNSPVAMEMARRIHTIAERASKAEAALAQMRAERDEALREISKRDQLARLYRLEDALDNPELSETQRVLNLCNLLATTRRKQLEAEQQLATVREALAYLRNEASGFLAMADVQAHGVTNLRCLQRAIDSADAALAPPPPEQP